MAATPAVRVLDRAKVGYTVHTYDHDPRADGYGAEAADALGLDPHRVFKTLLVAADGLRAPAAVGIAAVGIVPVSSQLDLKAVATALGAKRAAMADPADAQRLTGYVLGGISPLGQKRALPTVLDDSARDFDTVFVSGGRRGMEIELAPDDLARLTDAVVARVRQG
ncbi:MAG: Cys-tRNA(Pro) deacylase [Acidimicrobiia bacterium]|nr:Cys-tRNA(Pro) deacylase [Acidimicrobiia bacterium]